MSREVTPIADQLRARGMRVTAARHAVLEWLADNPHATVEHVHDGISQRLGSISKQAVYDVLNDVHRACLSDERVWYGGVHANRRKVSEDRRAMGGGNQTPSWC